jgi:hypothetical protein
LSNSLQGINRLPDLDKPRVSFISEDIDKLPLGMILFKLLEIVRALGKKHLPGVGIGFRLIRKFYLNAVIAVEHRRDVGWVMLTELKAYIGVILKPLIGSRVIIQLRGVWGEIVDGNERLRFKF